MTDSGQALGDDVEYSGAACAIDDQLFMGIDVATETVRIGVYDGAGKKHAQSSGKLATLRRTGDGRLEQDAASWWPTTRDVVRRVTQELQAESMRLGSVSVAATSGTLTAVDHHYQPICPGLMYSDRRASDEAEMIERVFRTHDRQSRVEIAGDSALAKAAWLSKNIRHPNWRFAYPSELITSMLVGDRTPVDWSHALKTGYDVDKLEWPCELLDAIGIQRFRLPDVEAPSTLVGAIGRRMSSDTGLPVGCEVRLGMTDGCAAQIAAGATHVGDRLSVLGTTLVVKGVSADRCERPSSLIYCHRFPENRWLCGGASNTGAGGLGRWDGDLLRRDEEASAHGPADVIRWPLVGIGERFPFRNASAMAFEIGVPRNAVEEFRADLEGIAYVERLAHEHLSSLGLKTGDRIYSAGRAAESQPWAKIRASVMRTPVAIAVDAQSARGAAILASVGRAFKTIDDAVDAMVLEGSVVEPDLRESSRLEENYQLFVRVLDDKGYL